MCGLGDGLGVGCALHQRLRKLGRDQKAHLLAIQPLGHVHAQHAARVVHRRATAHAGVERAAKKDARVKAALDQPVVGALGHRKANVQRVAQRVDALALRQWVGGGAKAQHRRCCRAPLGAQHGQVALHVKRQQLHLALLPLHRHVNAPVALGLQRQLAGHVKVGDDQPIGRHKKARANRRLRVGIAQQRADLHQLVARQLVNAPRIARQQGRIGGGGCGGCGAARCGGCAIHSGTARRARGRGVGSSGWGGGLCVRQRTQQQQQRRGRQPQGPNRRERHRGIL